MGPGFRRDDVIPDELSGLGRVSGLLSTRLCVSGRLAGVEVERYAVHAIAQPGRLRPVLEDMAEMPAAPAAMHLGAGHEEAAVGVGLDHILERRREARPAGAAVELGGGVEQGLAAAGAVIDPGAVLLVERARAGALGAVLAQYPILLGREAPAPFLVAQRHLEILARRSLGRRAAAAQAAE